MSWHLPPQPLRRRTLVPFAFGTLAAMQLADLLSPRIGVSEAYPVKAILVFGVVAIVAAGQLAATHPFDRLGPANLVTTLRVLLLSLVAALIGEGPTSAVAWGGALLAVVITALDGVDGWLARRTNYASEFGARYDMETDALLILVLAVLAWKHDKAGAWIVLAGAMRYLFVASGHLWTWMNRELPQSQRRKTVCVVQIVGLIVVVSPIVTAPGSVVVAALTLLTLTWSFGVDVWWLHQHRQGR
ncbi:MAG: CDP-alcohol phosphatidyltransferase family protein [Vicinamibacterales bacterium]